MHVDFTASALIIHPDGDKVLLIFHRKLQKRMQAGGHVDPGKVPHETALREAKEETGLDCILDTYRHPTLFQDIDSILPTPLYMEKQVIPAYKEQAEHIHCDSFYVLKPLSTEFTAGDHGVEDTKRYTLSEIQALGDTCFPLLPKIIAKILTQNE